VVGVDLFITEMGLIGWGFGVVGVWLCCRGGGGGEEGGSGGFV
jgi:hypothetical protein